MTADQLALEALMQIKATLALENEKGAQNAIVDTIWHGPAETLFDYIDNSIAAVTAAQAPAVGADDAKDAARFRWLIDDRNWNENEDTPSVCTSEDVHWGNKARALIDRHMESQPPIQPMGDAK